MAYFDSVLIYQPNYPDAMYNKGLCLEEMGEKALAIEMYRSTLSVDPQHDKAAMGVDRLE